MADYNLTAEFSALHAQIAKVNTQLTATIGNSNSLVSSVGTAITGLESQYAKLNASIEEVNKALIKADPKEGGLKGYVSVVAALMSEFKNLAAEAKKVSEILKAVGNVKSSKNSGTKEELNNIKALKQELGKLKDAYAKAELGSKNKGTADKALAELKARLNMLEQVKQKTIEMQSLNAAKGGDTASVSALKKEEQVRDAITKRAKELVAIEASYKGDNTRLAGIQQLEKQYGVSMTSISAKIDAIKEKMAGMTDAGSVKKAKTQIEELQKSYEKLSGKSATPKKVEISVDQALKDLTILEQKSGQTIGTLTQRIALLKQKKLKIPIANLGDIQKVNTEIDSLNAKLKQTQTATQKAGNTRGMRRFAESLRLVAVQIASVWTIARALSKVFTNIVDFEYVMTGVAAVTGGAANEMRSLRDMAIELGGATIFTAMQFAELELSLGKLGFKTNEIIAATKSIGDLTAAFGGDLSNNASIAGSTLRAFRMEATDIGQITDTMASSFSNSALDVEKFRESMKFAAPVAQKFGFSVQETTSLLAKLADAGLYGSLAGTSLRNIMLKLADSGSELNKTMGFQVKTFDDFVGAMDTMSRAGFDLGDALDITDQRAVTAISTLMGSSGEIREFADELNYAEGAASRMAATRMDTLKGSINKVKSAWQGMTLEVMNTEGGLLKGLSALMKALAANMKTVVTVGLLLATVLIAITKNKITNGIRNIGIGLKNVRTAMQAATKSALTFKSAMKGFGALIPFALAGVIAMYKILTKRNKEVKAAQKGLIEGYTSEMREVGALVNKLGSLKGADEKTTAQREKLYNMIEKKYPGILKNLDHEEGKLIDQAELLKIINKEYAKKLRLASGQAEVGVDLGDYGEAEKKLKEYEQEFYNNVLDVAQNKGGGTLLGVAEELGINLGSIEDVLKNKDVLAGFYSGLVQSAGRIKDAENKVVKEYDDFIGSLESGSAEAWANDGAAGYKQYFRGFAEEIKNKGIDPLKAYLDIEQQLKDKAKASTGLMAEMYSDQAAAVHELVYEIIKLKKTSEDANEIKIRVNAEGMDKVLQANTLKKFDLYKKQMSFGKVIEETGLWSDEIADLGEKFAATGEIMTSYDVQDYYTKRFGKGINGAIKYRKEAQEKWLREVTSLKEQIADEVAKGKEGNTGAIQKLTKDLASLEDENNHEALLSLYEALVETSGSGGKADKSDLTKVLKAIYEERKAYIDRTYTDTKARDVLLLKLESEYQHQLSKITIEKDDERLGFQLANYMEFVNKSSVLLRDFVKENKEAYRALKEEDPFGLDTGDKGIAANKKRFDDMRKNWNGQSAALKGVSSALSTFQKRSNDMDTTMVDNTKSITEELSDQLSTTKGKADMMEIVNKLQAKGVNIESDFVNMIQSGNIDMAYMDKMIADINSQIVLLTAEATKLEKQINFKLVWDQTRRLAKMAYDEEIAYMDNLTENRKRGMGVGMSSFWADMATLSTEKKNLVQEEKDLSKLLADAQNGTTFLEPEQIEAKKKELEELGYSIDAVKRDIYDTGKDKTFLDYIKWNTGDFDKEGAPVMGSLTDDQQEGIRKSVAFMKDMATQMADAWKEAIDSVVAKYDELISASDSKIGELQNDLSREKDLLIAGYANNYDTVKKELALEREKRTVLRKERTKALAEQKRAQKVQEKIELATQAANIFTTVTEIWKTFVKDGGIAGVLVAGGVTAAFLGGMYALKQSVKKKYNVPTAREGTTGVLTGRSHESGGEQIPVIAESGERYSVFSRPATKKYGGLLEEMTNKANSLTLDSMLYGDVTPIISDNNKAVVNNINNGFNVAYDNSNARKQLEVLKDIRNRPERWNEGDYVMTKEGNVTTAKKVKGK